jgi:hypothetical protein
VEVVKLEEVVRHDPSMKEAGSLVKSSFNEAEEVRYLGLDLVLS